MAFNKFLVSRQGDYTVILNPPRRMLDEDALEFAAWIVALLPPQIQDKFPEILNEVQNT